MIIIAGKIYVPEEKRDKHVKMHQKMVARARKHPGCLDLVIAADPLEAERVNIFESWESEEALAQWRELANPPETGAEFKQVDVQKHQVSESGPPF